MFKAVTSHSIMINSADIVNDLVGQADVKLGVYRPAAGILYASTPHDLEKLKAVLKGLCRAFPGIQLVGGTVVGGFTDESGYLKDGYFLCLLVSDTATFHAGCIQDISTLIQSGQFSGRFKTCLQERSLGTDPAACFLYSGYKNVDGDQLIDGIQEVLPENCLLFGGMATAYWTEQDIADFSKKVPPAEQSLLFIARDDVLSVVDDALVFLLFQGEIEVQHGVSYGWSDIGMLYPARGEGSILAEIDGREPRAFLRDLNHPLALEEYNNSAYSLWIHVRGKDPHIRDLFFDKSTGKYYTHGATLPAHFQVSFSFPEKERLLNQFQNCLRRLNSQQKLVIAITCCTHQVVLEQDVSREYGELVRMFPQTPIISGYVFGEYGPSLTTSKGMLHSCSSILFCLAEKRDSDSEGNGTIKSFLDKIVREQGNEIKSLQKQLRFFEESKDAKMKKLTEACLGILLCRSHKSLSSHAQQISDTLKGYYRENGLEPPYAVSRNRLIAHLMKLKRDTEKFLLK